MKRTVKCMTKKDKDGQAAPTLITFDYEGVTMDDLLAGWEDQAVIKLQSKFRRGEGAIPAAHQVRVKGMCAGRAAEVVTVDTLAANAATLTPEQRAALIAKLTGK
jgi:hypothetical protein